MRDDKDFRLIRNIADKYFNYEMLQDGYKFSKSGLYYSPAAGSLEQYISYIESLPNNTAPEAYEMDNNNEIIRGERELMDLINSLKCVQIKHMAHQNQKNKQKVMKIVDYIEKSLPSLWNLQEVQ